jgi:hypothetical protein
MLCVTLIVLRVHAIMYVMLKPAPAMQPIMAKVVHARIRSINGRVRAIRHVIVKAVRVMLCVLRIVMAAGVTIRATANRVGVIIRATVMRVRVMLCATSKLAILATRHAMDRDVRVKIRAIIRSLLGVVAIMYVMKMHMPLRRPQYVWVE